MKKFFLLILLGSIILTIGCNGEKTTKIINADYRHYTSIDELADMADDIIRGKVVGRRVEELYIGETPYLYTIFTIKVEEVYKGTNKKEDSETEIMQIGGENKEEIVISEDFVELEENVDYVFFLSSYSDYPSNLLNPKQAIFLYNNSNNRGEITNPSEILRKDDPMMTLYYNELQEIKEKYKSFTGSLSDYVPSIVIIRNNETNFKDQIVNEIMTAKNMTEEEHKSYGNYRNNKIDEIEEFYFPNLEIDGFELSVVKVNDNYFNYEFSPTKEIDIDGIEKEELYQSEEVIIEINRPREGVFTNKMELTAKRAGEEGWEHLIEDDNMFYSEQGGYIIAQIGDIWFSIVVPPHMSKYEILRDLANDVINSAELVKVDGYKLPETKEPPITDEPTPTEEVTLDFAASAVGWEGEFSTTAVVEE